MSISDEKILRILKGFEENVRSADEVREKYPGEFIAVCENKVVAHNRDRKSLIQEIPDEYAKNPEIFIVYISKENEIFL